MGLGLLALVPNSFPLVALIGVMALLDVALMPSSILVFPLAFGIAVDDSIHLMGRFTHLVRSGLGRGRVARAAIRETGPALVMSTVVVITGFALLLVSRFELLHLVGLLSAVTAVTALLGDLVLFRRCSVRCRSRCPHRGRSGRGPSHHRGGPSLSGVARGPWAEQEAPDRHAGKSLTARSCAANESDGSRHGPDLRRK